MKDLITAAIKELKASRSLVMATIIRHKGSTPRETGTRFIIRQDGTTLGTIGGGTVESETITKGLELFANKGAVLLQFDMAQQHLGSGSMICGGNLTILLDCLEPTPEFLLVLTAWEQAYLKHEPSTLIIELDEPQPGKYKTAYGLAGPSGTVTGDLVCPESLLQRIHSTIPDANNPALLTIEDTKYWAEPLAFPKKLILFGAGHVARFTAWLGVQTGFETLVIDDRPDLLSRDSFPEPITLKPIGSLAQACTDLPIDPDCYLVILTRSHSFDKLILSQALRANFAYLGMIGSKRKRDTIFQSILNEGFSKEELEKVHSPIGLEIGASTPEEIAVSIIAQLIQVRSNH